MLIDWITARVSLDYFDVDTLRYLHSQQDKICRVSGDGTMVWESAAWDSIRSDSHQLSFRITSDQLWFQGSPARVFGDGDNVFGSGPAAALNLIGCVERMASLIAKQLGVILPADYARYKVSRIDVTDNLLLDSLADVRTALSVLRGCEGGRYRVSQQAGDSVYWSHRSRLRSGKAYAKGPHLLHLMKKLPANYNSRIYTTDEIHLANRLLRLELKLGAQYWRERTDKPWHKTTPDDLKTEWEHYFDRMIGGSEIVNDTDLKSKIFAVAKTEGQGKAAYGCWALIKSEGWERAREMYTKPTWYRNLKVLRRAGLSDADLSAGNVVMLRRKIIEAQSINSWPELRLAA